MSRAAVRTVKEGDASKSQAFETCRQKSKRSKSGLRVSGERIDAVNPWGDSEGLISAYCTLE